MYYQHSYAVPNGDDFLQLPAYMYNGTSYPSNFGQTCGNFDLICKAKSYFEDRDAALTSEITIPERNDTLLFGMIAVAALGLGIGFYLALRPSTQPTVTKINNRSLL